jgi:cystathionine beta-lyase
MTDPRDLTDADELRRRGSLKWTGTRAAIGAWVAESDLGTAPAVTSALRAAVDAGLFGYLPPAVRAELGRACATWQADRYGWQVDPARVHPVTNVIEAFRIAIERYSRPGSPVIVPTPAYMPFVTAPLTWGREVIQVPLTEEAGRDVLDLERIEEAFAAGGHLLVLVNPHTPTGAVARVGELTALAEVVDRHGGRVFADEVHAPLLYPGSRHVPYASLSPTTASHTLTATSASKGWNVAGLRCAQVVLSNDADAVAWVPLDALLTDGASTLGAVANTAAWAHGGPWLDEVLGYLDGNRHELGRVLSDLAPLVGYRPPEATYLAWLDLRAGLAARADAAPPWATAPVGALGRWIRDHTGVAVTDGALCGEAGRGFVRLNLAMPRPLVADAARRIADALR